MNSATAKPVLDPVAEALARAPAVQTLTPEQRAELDQIWEDMKSGRIQGVRHEDVPAWLEEQGN